MPTASRSSAVPARPFLSSAAPIGRGLAAFALVALATILAVPLALAQDRPGASVPGELIVQFKDRVKAQASNAALDAIGAAEAVTLDRLGAQRVKVAGADVAAALARLRSDPAVDFAEPNYLYHLTDIPNDSLFSQQWALRNTGQSGGLAGADMRGPHAWDVSAGSQEVLVAIIDSGVDYTHPDLAANIWTNRLEIGGNGIDEDGNGYVDDVRGWDFASGNNDPMDGMSHGTHVAGIVGAVGNNRIGIAGIAWHVKLMPLKVADPAGDLPLDAAIRAIDYASRMGARIINASWGGPDSSEALRRVIQLANTNGVLFVAAAGNFGQNNDLIPFYPANYEIPNVISVASTDNRDQLAWLSSNWGPATVDLAAPGVNILSTVLAGGYGLRSGTSMASPYVAGALALLLDRFPQYSISQAKSLLLGSVTPVAALAGKLRSGGRLDAFAPLQSRLLQLTDVGAGLPSLACGAGAWGDFDNDGDLDLVVSGDAAGVPVTRIYRNGGGGSFTDIGAALPGVTCGAVAWGDYDNDSDLDLLVTGATASGPIARLYRNDGGTFTDVPAPFVGVQNSAAAWGDFDNDGDLDLFVTGASASGKVSHLYRNDDHGVFTDVPVGAPGVSSGAVAWGDFDNDGDLDLLLAGSGATGDLARVYRNTAGVFTDAAAGLPGTHESAVAWADYDSDGDLDLLLSGIAAAGRTTRLYRNDAGAFTDAGAGLPGVSGGAAAWGDFDNDGDPDLGLTGSRDSLGVAVPYSRILLNDGGSFRPVDLALPALVRGSVAWADFDNDGDLDLMLAGGTGASDLVRVYRGQGAGANTPPSPPSGLYSVRNGDQLTLSWNGSFDTQTPASALTYNVRVGSTPLGVDFGQPMSNAVTGYRRVVQLGNANERRSWTVMLPPGAQGFFWSVQAVDGAFAGSAFAPDQGPVRTLGVGEGAAGALSFDLLGRNPVVDEARFSIGLPASARVRLSIHDVAGRRVALLVDGVLGPGFHAAAWSPAGQSRPAGVYFARLAVDGRTLTQTIVTLR